MRLVVELKKNKHTPAIHAHTVTHKIFSLPFVLAVRVQLTLPLNIFPESALEPPMDYFTHLSVHLSIYGPIPLIFNEEI